VLYAKGYGVPQDNVRAYMCYNLAATNSTGERQKFPTGEQEKVARRMTPVQIAEAQRLAQDSSQSPVATSP